MIRLVLDTNIIVSALLQPAGPSAQIVLLAVSGSVQLCISGNVYCEYEEVIRRPRLRFEEHVIAGALQTIREKSLWVRPTEVVQACNDPDDDIFLECGASQPRHIFGNGQYQAFPDFLALYPDHHASKRPGDSVRMRD